MRSFFEGVFVRMPAQETLRGVGDQFRNRRHGAENDSGIGNRALTVQSQARRDGSDGDGVPLAKAESFIGRSKARRRCWDHHGNENLTILQTRAPGPDKECV